MCVCANSFIQSRPFPNSLINGTDHPQTCRQECVCVQRQTRKQIVHSSQDVNEGFSSLAKSSPKH